MKEDTLEAERDQAWKSLVRLKKACALLEKQKAEAVKESQIIMSLLKSERVLRKKTLEEELKSLKALDEDAAGPSGPPKKKRKLKIV